MRPGPQSQTSSAKRTAVTFSQRPDSTSERHRRSRSSSAARADSSSARSAQKIRLSAAERKQFAVNGGFAGLGTSASLAANLAEGTGGTWKLSFNGGETETTAELGAKVELGAVIYLNG